mmetsp:Transcript_9041/g.20286  ORF Transcript_9041/g.20286 Transcript_9041/m.20286 type:complete len:977 (-) Transcript_9041:100-3030(-)
MSHRMSRRRSRNWDIREGVDGGEGTGGSGPAGPASPVVAPSSPTNGRGGVAAAAPPPVNSPARNVSNARQFIWAGDDEEDDMASFYADEQRASFSDAVSPSNNNNTSTSRSHPPVTRTRHSTGPDHYHGQQDTASAMSDSATSEMYSVFSDGRGNSKNRSSSLRSSSNTRYTNAHVSPSRPTLPSYAEANAPDRETERNTAINRGGAGANAGRRSSANFVWQDSTRSQLLSPTEPSRQTGTNSRSNNRADSNGSISSDRRHLYASLKQSTTASYTQAGSNNPASSALAKKIASSEKQQQRSNKTNSTRSNTVTSSIIDFYKKSESGIDRAAKTTAPASRARSAYRLKGDQYSNHDRSARSLGTTLSRAVSTFGRTMRQTFVMASANATDVPDYQPDSDTVDYSDNIAPAARLRDFDDASDPGSFGSVRYTKRRRVKAPLRRMGMVAAVILAVAAIIVGVSVGVMNKKNRSDQSQETRPQAADSESDEIIEGQNDEESGVPSDENNAPRPGIDDSVINGLDTPDTARPPAPSRSERFVAIRERIHSSKVSSLEDLDYEDSPQYMALDWLANEDRAQLSPQDEFLIQRFSLAVLYLSTHADETSESGGWTTTTNWLTSNGHCSWYGVLCRYWNGVQVLTESFDGNGDVFVLNLTSNGVSGTIPPEIMALEDLRVLDLSDNLIEGTIPMEIGGLISLLQLDLSSNGLTGTIPPQISALSQCTDLILNTNWLVGSLPPIGDMDNLELLALHENQLTGTLIDFSKMKNLEELYVDSNALSGELSPMPSSLTDLRLGSNNLFGHVDSLFHLENLETLYIDHNALSGTLPPSIFKLQRLKSLQAHENYLTGTIPHMIDRLAALEILYLDHNEFEGTIPAFLPKQLSELFLHHNQLEGRIPPSISSCEQLKKLYLHENQLGATENAIPSLPISLIKVHLHGNSFVGEMPRDVCSLRYHNLIDFTSDCDGESPEIACFCCTSCSS